MSLLYLSKTFKKANFTVWIWQLLVYKKKVVSLDFGKSVTLNAQTLLVEAYQTVSPFSNMYLHTNAKIKSVHWMIISYS